MFRQLFLMARKAVLAAASLLPDAQVRLGAPADGFGPSRIGLLGGLRPQPAEEGGPFGGDVGRLVRRDTRRYGDTRVSTFTARAAAEDVDAVS